MIRLTLLLVTLAGCGRLRFDEIARDDGALDALAGHDEDGDGLPDAIDLCPQIAGDNADADGDEVGDACDPNPSTPTERITLFATMQPGDAAFTDITGWRQDADSLHGDICSACPAPNLLLIDHPVATARIDVRFTISGIFGDNTVQHQVASGIESPEPFYFAELDDNGPAIHDVGVFSYDQTNGYVALGMVNIPGVHVGAGYQRIDVNATTKMWSVETGWFGELYTANAPTASYPGGPRIRFVVNNLSIEVSSVTVVETQ